MREIIFRAKNIDNGEWVEGSFIPDLREVFYSDYLCDGFIKPFGKTKEERLMVEVDRDTVGQYTGLMDKHGMKIWEGDIIRYQHDNDDCPFPNKDVKKRIGRIFFQGFRASFAVAEGRNGKEYLNQDLFHYVQNGNRVEVIGNIWDNPELLKEGE